MSVIPLPAPAPHARLGAASPMSTVQTAMSRLRSYAALARDEPANHVTIAPEAEAALPQAIDEAKRAMLPADPARVTLLLKALADRFEVSLPDIDSLRIDVRLMSRWPADLMEEAVLRVWEEFDWKMFPRVGTFRKAIEQELEARQRLLSDLCVLEQKLELRRRFPQAMGRDVTAERLAAEARKRSDEQRLRTG